MIAAPGVWSEFLSDDEVSAALPALARSVSRLHLSVVVDRIDDPGFARLTRAATALGIDVYLWLLFPVGGGYWIGEHNARELPAVVDRLVDLRSARDGLVFRGVSFDLEPGYAYAEALRKASLPNKVRTLLQHVEPSEFVEARRHLVEAVRCLHRHDLRAHATGFPVVLDDESESRVLEDALDTPISDVDWDEVSFMVYQTAFAELAGTWFGPALVASYARSAVQRFGDRAGLDLGVVGSAALGLGAGHRYPDVAALAADLAAATGAGIPLERIRVYGLAGVLEQGGPERWFARRPASTLPATTREVRGLRATMSLLSALLKAGTCSRARSSW
ncbi:MAG: hypothetical protein R3B13_40755 [Polyangiaceae bacterium]